MNTYEIKGRSRELGAIGILEPFGMAIKANSEREARDGVINIMSKTREHISIETCEFGGYNNTPMYFDTSKIRDTDELKRAVSESHSPYFFTPETMRFFRSRLSPFLLHCDDGVIFITSEQFETYCPTYRREPRQYTVRMFTNEGEIKELSEFQEFDTLREAKRYAAKYVK